MEIREYKTYNESEILRLYTSVGWTAYTDQPEVLRKGFEGSMLTLAAYEGDQLLGIIRTVGDGHTIVFVQDILVFPEHQRKGFGSALLQAVLNRTAMFVRLSWQRITRRKPLLFTSQWDSMNCPKSVAVDL